MSTNMLKQPEENMLLNFGFIPTQITADGYVVRAQCMFCKYFGTEQQPRPKVHWATGKTRIGISNSNLRRHLNIQHFYHWTKFSKLTADRRKAYFPSEASVFPAPEVVELPPFRSRPKRFNYMDRIKQRVTSSVLEKRQPVAIRPDMGDNAGRQGDVYKRTKLSHIITCVRPPTCEDISTDSPPTVATVPPSPTQTDAILRETQVLPRLLPSPSNSPARSVPSSLAHTTFSTATHTTFCTAPQLTHTTAPQLIHTTAPQLTHTTAPQLTHMTPAPQLTHMTPAPQLSHTTAPHHTPATLSTPSPPASTPASPSTVPTQAPTQVPPLSLIVHTGHGEAQVPTPGQQPLARTRTTSPVVTPGTDLAGHHRSMTISPRSSESKVACETLYPSQPPPTPSVVTLPSTVAPVVHEPAGFSDVGANKPELQTTGAAFQRSIPMYCTIPQQHISMNATCQPPMVGHSAPAPAWPMSAPHMYMMAAPTDAHGTICGVWPQQLSVQQPHLVYNSSPQALGVTKGHHAAHTNTQYFSQQPMAPFSNLVHPQQQVFYSVS